MGATARERLRIALGGAVQGVGFRPFVCRLAAASGLAGFVRNDGAGVLIEAEGPSAALAGFLDQLTAAPPAHAMVTRQHVTRLASLGAAGFTITASAAEGACSAVVMADLATCPECLREIRDPADRRHRYPFTTCVACGPRYSVIEALPYDRAGTTLRRFPLCPACAAEYADPASRRFHAESLCCPDCGPQLALWDQSGAVLATRAAALAATIAALRAGRIVALKGLGGFQLLADARNDTAVRALRARKRRPRKPFAVLVADAEAAAALAEISDAERAVLTSPAAPIVLLAPKPAARRQLAPTVAAGTPCLGIMLPATPLHHLLAAELGVPIIATSGNPAGGPILADEAEALRGLGDMAELFLVHDRPIARPVDDSVVRVIAGEPTLLRRARGYAPLPLAWPGTDGPILALGGQQKNAVATGFGGRIFLGPHGGDLDTAAARDRFVDSATRLPALHGLVPARIACDRHPDYASTRHAETLGAPLVRVPHHLAHALSGMVDRRITGPFLAVAWDGTGHGGDGTVWGGEFLAIDPPRWRRAAHLASFRLPGGDAAAREPRRAALGVLHALHGPAALEMTGLAPLAAFAPTERLVLGRMLARGVAAPLTSSAGRLFDAVAALLGLCQRASFEGEAAMALEQAAGGAEGLALPVPLLAGEPRLVLDWRPTLLALLSQRAAGAGVEALAAGFHHALAAGIVAVARRLGAVQVLLTGGCFQNGRLAAAAMAGLREAGITVFGHRQVPPNDGGLAVGQIAFAAHPLIEDGPLIEEAG